jgi:hypothetical protein
MLTASPKEVLLSRDGLPQYASGVQTIREWIRLNIKDISSADSKSQKVLLSSDGLPQYASGRQVIHKETAYTDH